MSNYGDWSKMLSFPYSKWTVIDKESGLKVLDGQSIQYVILILVTMTVFTVQIICKRTEIKLPLLYCLFIDLQYDTLEIWVQLSLYLKKKELEKAIHMIKGLERFRNCLKSKEWRGIEVNTRNQEIFFFSQNSQILDHPVKLNVSGIGIHKRKYFVSQ